ncbi:MAG: 50S ribosomal protein L19e [Candidatus Woesearchaeota archaeon]
MMLQKRLAAQVLNCSPNRITFDPEKLGEIKEAITKFDVGRLIRKGIITRAPVQGTGKFRTRHAMGQKRRSRRVGPGSRKGSANARADDKLQWMRLVRAQRDLLKRLKEHNLITHETFNMLYQKSKGGFFRSTRHIKLFLKEQGLFIKK